MKNTCVHAIKTVLKISAFAAILIYLFGSFSYLLRPVGFERTNISGFYAEKRNSLDAVYIGGSVCFVSWSPLQAFEEKGIASYDFAVNTMEADTLVYCIKEVLKTQSPELLIIDARPFQYRDVDQPPTEVAIRNISDAMAYSFNRSAMLQNVVPPVLHEDVPNYLFDIAKYHDRWKDIGKDSFLYAMDDIGHPYKGFAFISKKAPLARPDDNSLVAGKTPPREDTLAILEDLLTYCQKIDQKVLFVVAPYGETSAEKEVFNFVGGVIKEKGFDFVDFNDYWDEMGIDFDDDFYNVNHLSIYGARKYTTYLAQYLADRYNLPDRREDPQYGDQWHEQYKAWEADYRLASYTIEHDLFVKAAPTIYDYLARASDERYSVFIASMDASGGYYSAGVSDLMRKLGLSFILADEGHSSYLGVIDRGIVAIEEAADTELAERGFLMDGTEYSVISAGNDGGNTCSILLNNVEYAKKAKGMNIVIYDNKTAQVVDSVCFDTSSFSMALSR